MKIESAEIRHLALPLVKPFRTAFGEERTIHSVMVRMSSGGVTAGENQPRSMPHVFTRVGALGI